MKKMICVLLVLLMISALAGCGTDENTSSSKGQGTDITQTENKNKSSNGIDVDLTKLSSTMVYSEVYNMMDNPSDYIGKTVKMNGKFSLYQATDANGQPVPDQIYYACVIADATACCQQGLEFILAGDAKYPNDYPEQGTKITVVGEFKTYMEGTKQYCHLVNAELTD